MRSLHSSLGITAFAAAMAVGVRTNSPHPLENAGANLEITATIQHPRSPTPSERRHPHKTAPNPRHRDLHRLTQTLGLSIQQQKDIHPALLRSHPDYDPSKLYRTLASDLPVFLGTPLSRPDFEDHLFAILDGEQQLDYVAATTEADAWWRSVISRLEADLDSGTNPSDRLPSPQPSPAPNRGRTLTLPPSTD